MHASTHSIEFHMFGTMAGFLENYIYRALACDVSTINLRDTFRFISYTS